MNRLRNMSNRRDGVFASLGIPQPDNSDDQLNFEFAQSPESANNSVGERELRVGSWNEAYEAGYVAGLKMGKKQVEQDTPCNE